MSSGLNVLCKEALALGDEMNGEKIPEDLDQNETMRENNPVDPNQTYQEGSNQNEMAERTNNSDKGESQRRAAKKPNIFRWNHEHQHKFLEALKYLGPNKRSPKLIVEYMNVPELTRKQVASHLQKYRLQIQKFEEDKASYIGPQSSYNSKSLYQEYLSEFHPNYGIGQSSSPFVNNSDSNNQEYLPEFHPSYGIGQPSTPFVNNNDSNNHMYYGQNPIYDLSQAGSNLVPTVGESFGFSNEVLPVDEAGRCNIQIPLNTRNNVLGPNGLDMRMAFGTSQLSQVPRLGQSYAPTNVLGMNSNLGIGFEQSNGNGSLGENWGDMNWNLENNTMYNHGSSTASFPSTVATFLDNKVQSQSSVVAQPDGVVPRTAFATPQVSQVPLYGQHVTTNNVLDMNPDHSTGYIHSNYTGIITNEHGHFAGNGNVSHCQNYVGTMNSNLNNNMMSNHGCSTPRFTSPYQSISNLNAQMNDLVHVPQNPSMPSDHQGINQIFNNTINSQFNQNNNDNLERNAIPNWSFDDVNANTNAEMLNSVASNSGMYVPTPNMNSMNQVQGAEDLEELPLPYDLEELPLPYDLEELFTI